MPDVVIVGGGVIGAACALELAERGASVTLVERDHLAAHASGRNQGLVGPARGRGERADGPGEPGPLPRARARRADRLPARRSNRSGMVLVANDRAGVPGREGRRGPGTRQRCPPSTNSTPRRRSATPNPRSPATSPAAGSSTTATGMDPGALTVALALAAAERGATIRHHLHARALAVRDDTVRGVVTDDGVIEADTTIVAGGPWSPALLDPVGVHLPIVGARGWIVRVRARPRSARPPDRIARPACGVARGRGEPSPDGPRGRDRRVPGQRDRHHRAPAPRRADRADRLVPADLAHARADGGRRGPHASCAPRSRSCPRSGARAPVVVVGPAAALPRRATVRRRRARGLDGRDRTRLRRRDPRRGTAQLVAAQIAGETPPFDPAPFDPLRFEA